MRNGDIRKIKIIGICVLSVLMFFLLMYQGTEHILLQEIQVESKENSAPHISSEKMISVTIIAGDQKANLEVVRGMSLYDALVLAKENEDISFSGKNYSGLGFFVTDIGSLHSAYGTHLFYSINSSEASVGVSSYILKNGDIIEWKLK